MKDNSDQMFPISWDSAYPCGCIVHHTDKGTGYYSRRDYCEFHKNAIKKIKELMV